MHRDDDSYVERCAPKLRDDSEARVVGVFMHAVQRGWTQKSFVTERTRPTHALRFNLLIPFGYIVARNGCDIRRTKLRAMQNSAAKRAMRTRASVKLKRSASFLRSARRAHISRLRAGKKKFWKLARCAQLWLREERATIKIAHRTAKVIRFDVVARRLRSPICSSTGRSPPVDSLCRRWSSSPVRRTIRAWSASPRPGRPCRDWL